MDERRSVQAQLEVQFSSTKVLKTTMTWILAGYVNYNFTTIKLCRSECKKRTK